MSRFAEILALSPAAFAWVLAAMVFVVVAVCATFIWALHITLDGVEGSDRAAVIAEVGQALKAFVFWSRK
ncbi:hypothetical protein [Streptomyces sp. ITFR-16]|uniref:hypothetical protein n=1 Tax=Streptomyces sp. ITFR-16 TaxID=3075198 RepID=UPI00288A25A2|nr:hypothetical protein [Streptomyces sp. ITFR-16]WNI26045.1 hypothetical protein RLT58_31035 [Streptomyces sp. ITFR-16]